MKFNGCLAELKASVNPLLLRLMDSNDKKGASRWVTASPLYDQHTVLCKRDFWDALCLRYGWLPKVIPTACAGGGSFDVRHAFSCLL